MRDRNRSERNWRTAEPSREDSRRHAGEEYRSNSQSGEDAFGYDRFTGEEGGERGYRGDRAPDTPPGSVSGGSYGGGGGYQQGSMSPGHYDPAMRPGTRGNHPESAASDDYERGSWSHAEPGPSHPGHGAGSGRPGERGWQGGERHQGWGARHEQGWQPGAGADEWEEQGARPFGERGSWQAEPRRARGPQGQGGYGGYGEARGGGWGREEWSGGGWGGQAAPGWQGSGRGEPQRGPGMGRGEAGFGSGAGVPGGNRGFGYGGGATGYGEWGGLGPEGPYAAEPGQGGYGGQWGSPAGTHQDTSGDWRGRGEWDRGTHSMRGGEAWSVPGPFTGRGPKGYERSDSAILEDVCERLTRHGDIDASEIQVRCEGREVILEGTVSDRRAKRMAEDTAETVPGVRDVQNRLRVSERGAPDEHHRGGSSHRSEDDRDRGTSAGRERGVHDSNDDRTDRTDRTMAAGTMAGETTERGTTAAATESDDSADRKGRGQRGNERVPDGRVQRGRSRK